MTELQVRIYFIYKYKRLTLSRHSGYFALNISMFKDSSQRSPLEIV